MKKTYNLAFDGRSGQTVVSGLCLYRDAENEKGGAEGERVEIQQDRARGVE